VAELLRQREAGERLIDQVGVVTGAARRQPRHQAGDCDSRRQRSLAESTRLRKNPFS
jgi:hypothetical protein